MTLSNEAFEVIDAVHEHWVLRGVHDAHEMRDELADHLDAALSDGKSVEDVTGADLLAFADAWAAEHERDSVRWTWALAALLVLMSGSVATVIAVVSARSLDVRIDLADVLVTVAIGIVSVLVFRSRLTRGTRLRSRRRTLVRNAVLFASAALCPVLLVRLWGPNDVRLAPWVTVLMVSPLAVVLVVLFAVDVPGVRQLLGVGDRDVYRAELRRRLAAHDEFESRWKPSDD